MCVVLSLWQKEVNKALATLLEQVKGISKDEAIDEIGSYTKSGRYQKDIY